MSAISSSVLSEKLRECTKRVFFSVSTVIVPGVRVIEFANITCAASLLGDRGTSNIFCLIFICGLNITLVTAILDFNISLISQKQYVIKINKFISDNTLLNQLWIMDPKKKVSDIIKENKKNNDIKIIDFTRFKVGEGV